MIKKVMRFGLILNLLVVSFITFAQAPAQFNFQGVARYSNGDVIVARPIALRFSIRTGSAGGPVSYQERRSTPTDSNGVFNAVIGGVNATNTFGTLDTVQWTIGKFLQVEIDTANGINFINLGATQMLSVPFALFSNNSLYAGYAGYAGYADSARSTRHADSSKYASSSGSYFFEAVFPSRDTVLPGTLVFSRTNYNESINDSNIIRPLYDSTTGKFKAPIDGLYQFEVSLSEIPHEMAENSLDYIFLVKNGVKIRTLNINDYNYKQFIHLHCTVSLKRNDIVTIQATDNGAIEAQSTFSGFKIK